MIMHVYELYYSSLSNIIVTITFIPVVVQVLFKYKSHNMTVVI